MVRQGWFSVFASPEHWGHFNLVIVFRDNVHAQPDGQDEPTPRLQARQSCVTISTDDTETRCRLQSVQTLFHFSKEDSHSRCSLSTEAFHSRRALSMRSLRRTIRAFAAAIARRQIFDASTSSEIRASISLSYCRNLLRVVSKALTNRWYRCRSAIFRNRREITFRIGTSNPPFALLAKGRKASYAMPLRRPCVRVVSLTIADTPRKTRKRQQRGRSQQTLGHTQLATMNIYYTKGDKINVNYFL
jgi:hypothetical protein